MTRSRGAFSMMTCLILSGTGCVVGEKVASPDTELVVGVKTERTLDADLEAGDATTLGTGNATTGGGVGKIGGDGDSIALWMAIAALGAAPMSYPVSRSLRRGLERWRGRTGPKG